MSEIGDWKIDEFLFFCKSQKIKVLFSKSHKVGGKWNDEWELIYIKCLFLNNYILIFWFVYFTHFTWFVFPQKKINCLYGL